MGLLVISVKKMKLLLLSVFGLLGCMTMALKGEVQIGSKGRPELRVGTYNVFVGSRNFPQTAAVIRKMDADVIALQEVLPGMALALHAEFKHDCPYRYFSSGLGFLSRIPLRNPRFQKSNKGINGFLFAEVDYRRQRIQIANLHLDPLRLWTFKDKLMLPFQFSKQGKIHRDELGQIFQNLEHKVPIILLGDFNRASNASVDILGRSGFTDSFAVKQKRPDFVPTLHFSMFGVSFGRRIDYIFHSEAFHTTASLVISGRPSDHDAVVSVLTLSKSGGTD